MAASFPLSAAQFINLLPIRQLSFELPEAVELAETGGGELLRAELGARLWQGEVTLAELLPDEAAEVGALLDLLRGAAGSFMVHDPVRPWPRADWQGAGLSGTSPVIAALASNGRELSLSGLPSGYVLMRGDPIGWSYGSSPTRHALHRLVAPATANGAGATGLIEVVPPIRPGVTVSTPVILAKPACKAVVIPGSVQPGQRRAQITVGAAFKWQQTLR